MNAVDFLFKPVLASVSMYIKGFEEGGAGGNTAGDSKFLFFDQAYIGVKIP